MYEINTSVSTIANSFTDIVSSEKSYKHARIIRVSDLSASVSASLAG